MVKIKVEKKMNLAELIQYIIDNDITDSRFHTQNDKYIRVWSDGGICIYDRWNGGKDNIDPKALFTVLVEEEITEETKIPLLLEICKHFDFDRITSFVSKNRSIARECDENSIAFHMINPDGTTKLLWTKKGGMVE